jgi:hypothetical protein
MPVIGHRGEMLSVLVLTVFNIKFGVDSDFDEDISPWQDPPNGWEHVVLVRAAKDQYLFLCVLQMKEAEGM